MSKTNIERSLRITATATLLGAAGVIALLALPLSFGSNPPPGPPVIGDDQMQVLSTTMLSTTIGGAQVAQTTRTVAHWFGSTLDPNNGITLPPLTWSAPTRTTAQAQGAM